MAYSCTKTVGGGGVSGTDVLLQAKTNKIPKAKIAFFIDLVLIYSLGYCEITIYILTTEN